MERTGSQIVIDALAEAGVEVVFGYPGGAIMPLYDTLVDTEAIEHVLTRHEQAAVHAADGYARASGRLGVCIATSGPGATNLVTGIITAAMDSVPLLCITGQVPVDLIGTDAFQETDIFGITTGITKQSYQVRSPDELPGILAEAIFVARSGRPGPVLIDIPKDVLTGTTNLRGAPLTRLPGYDATPMFDPASVKSAHELFKNALRPVCIVGGGCKLSGATEMFRRWCDATNVPVTTTLNGIGSTRPGYAGSLGMLGMHGLRRANRAVTACDLLLAFGIRFDDRVTGKVAGFAPDADIVHIDIDAAELGKIVGPNISINGDLRRVLESWLRTLERDPVAPFSHWRREAMEVGSGLDRSGLESGDLSARIVLDAVLDVAGPDTIVTTDVGQHQMWTAQRVSPSHPRKWITSGGAGTMGFGLPSAIGAQFACRDDRTLAVVGDGGFQMSLSELATLRRCDLPIKILVMDNKYLGMVRQWQEMFFDRRYSAVDMSDNPDFAMLARAYGLEAFTAAAADELSATIQKWWSCDGPALLHAVCALEENVFPMIPAGAGLAEMVESV